MSDEKTVLPEKSAEASTNGAAKAKAAEPRGSDAKSARRPAMRVHLQQAKVHSKLDFFDTVPGDKLTHHNLPRLILPAFKQV